MIAIFDNLNALIIGGTVLLMILAMQTRMTEINIEQSATYVVKGQAAEFATWMEDDLLALGTNIDRWSEIPFDNPGDSAGVTTSFTYYRDEITTTDTFRISTRYDLKKIKTQVVDDDTVNVFRMERWTRTDAGAWSMDGTGPAMLSHFKIEMLNRFAEPVSNPVAAATAAPDTIQNTRLRFTMVAPFQNDRTLLRRIYYGSTLMIPY